VGIRPVLRAHLPRFPSRPPSRPVHRLVAPGEIRSPGRRAVVRVVG
jgi:hypothetical protein